MLSQSISMGVIELKRKHDAAAVNSSLVRRPIRRWAPLFMGPMLCAFAIGFVYPFCKGVYLSFCKFKTTSDAQFIGFGNYIKALNDASFIHSFWYTALFALVSLVFINVLAFAVPLILSGMLQLLYNSADIIVVGRFADSVAMASVGATTSLIHLLVSLLMGLSVGASVAVARSAGAGDR